MGVNHLRRDAAVAHGGSAAGDVGKSPRSQQIQLGADADRPAETLGGRGNSVPKVGAVSTFDNKSVHPGNSAPRPATNLGGRAGAKSGQPKIGTFKDAKHPISGAELY